MARAPEPMSSVVSPQRRVCTALASPDILDKFLRMGVDPVAPHPPAAFGDLLQREIARWGKVIRDANVKVE